MQGDGEGHEKKLYLDYLSELFTIYSHFDLFLSLVWGVGLMFLTLGSNGLHWESSILFQLGCNFLHNGLVINRTT